MSNVLSRIVDSYDRNNDKRMNTAKYKDIEVYNDVSKPNLWIKKDNWKGIIFIFSFSDYIFHFQYQDKSFEEIKYCFS